LDHNRSHATVANYYPVHSAIAHDHRVKAAVTVNAPIRHHVAHDHWVGNAIADHLGRRSIHDYPARIIDNANARRGRNYPLRRRCRHGRDWPSN
jgi:hypothetical protein